MLKTMCQSFGFCTSTRSSRGNQQPEDTEANKENKLEDWDTYLSQFEEKPDLKKFDVYLANSRFVALAFAYVLKHEKETRKSERLSTISTSEILSDAESYIEKYMKLGHDYRQALDDYITVQL